MAKNRGDFLDFEKAINEMLNKYGYVNRKILIEEFGITQHQAHEVGGIKNYCRTKNIPYRYYSRPDPSDIMEDFKKVYDAYGSIDLTTYLENGKYSKQAIKTAYGSVNNLMKLLNIPLNVSRMDNKGEVASDIYRVFREHDRFSSTTYRKFGKYSQSVVERIWGTWCDAMDDLGLPIKNKKIGKEQMRRELTELYEQHGYLCKPLIDEMCSFTYQAVTAAFGGIDGAESELGIRGAFSTDRSTWQRELGNILKSMYGDEVEEEVTFDWLINPETGCHLRFDFYIESRNLCIEYDGQQHFVWTKWFHKTEDEFIASQRRDKFKENLAHANGVSVVRFSYKDKITFETVANRLNTAK